MERKFTIPSLYKNRDRLSNLMNEVNEEYQEPKLEQYNEMVNYWDYTCDVQIAVDNTIFEYKDYENTWCPHDEKVYIQGVFEERTVPYPTTLPTVPQNHPSEYMHLYHKHLRLYYPSYNYTYTVKPSEADIVSKRLRRNNKMAKKENIRMDHLMTNARAFRGSKELSKLAKYNYAGALFTIFHNLYLDHKKKEWENRWKAEKALKESNKKNIITTK